MFAEKTLQILKNYVDAYFDGKINTAAPSIGLDGDTLTKWLKGQRSPLKTIGPAIDKILGDSATPENVMRLKVVFDKDGSVAAESAKSTSETDSKSVLQQDGMQAASKIELLEQKIESLERELAYCKTINKELFKTLQRLPEDNSFRSFSDISDAQDSSVR